MGSKNAGLTLDEMGEVVASYGDTCSVEGCGKPYRAGVQGMLRGYCVRHSMLWRNNGEPRTQESIRREAFHRSIFHYMEERSEASRLAVLGAALQVGRQVKSSDPYPDVLLMASTRQAALLIGAAEAWADFDAEAPLADYVVASKALDAAVAKFRVMADRQRCIARLGRDEYLRQQRAYMARYRQSGRGQDTAVAA